METKNETKLPKFTSEHEEDPLTTSLDDNTDGIGETVDKARDEISDGQSTNLKKDLVSPHPNRSIACEVRTEVSLPSAPSQKPTLYPKVQAAIRKPIDILLIKPLDNNPVVKPCNRKNLISNPKVIVNTNKAAQLRSQKCAHSKTFMKSSSLLTSPHANYVNSRTASTLCAPSSEQTPGLPKCKGREASIISNSNKLQPPTKVSPPRQAMPPAKLTGIPSAPRSSIVRIPLSIKAPLPITKKPNQTTQEATTTTKTTVQNSETEAPVNLELANKSYGDFGESTPKKIKDPKYLVEMENKLNSVLKECAESVRKTTKDDDYFRDVVDIIESEKTPFSKRLNSIGCLVEKFCFQHLNEKEFIKDLQNQIKRMTEILEIMKERENNNNNFSEDMSKKDLQIEKLKKELKETRDELNTQKEIVIEKQRSIEKVTYDQEKLKAILAEMKAKVDRVDFLAKANTELQRNLDETTIQMKKNLSSHNQALQTAKRYYAEIVQLRSEVKGLSDAKEEMEEKIQQLQFGLRDSNDKLGQAELEAADLKKRLEKDKTMNAIDREEFSKLQSLEKKQLRKIEDLNVEIIELRAKICNLENNSKRDQQLLAVRSAVIEQMQKSEVHSRDALEQLYADLSERNRLLSELNNELRLSRQDCHNLYQSVSTKTIEVEEQALTLRQLHDSNERNQMLRVAQQEKIARLEDEVMRLKIFIGPSNKRQNPKPVTTEPPKKRDKSDTVRIRKYTS